MYKIMAKEDGDNRFSAISIDNDGISITNRVLFTSFFNSKIEANRAMKHIDELAVKNGVELELKVVKQ